MMKNDVGTKRPISLRHLLSVAVVVLVAAVLCVAPVAAEDTTVTTEAELKDALQTSGTVILGNDIPLTAGITIPEGVTVTLDLAGSTISYSSSETTGNAAITNKGTLTIKDSSEAGSGKITYSSSNPSANYAYATNTITNAGGTLTLLSGAIENTCTSGASYAIDNNNTLGDTTLTINGGKVTSGVDAIRQFCNSGSSSNDVTIKDGTIEGAGCADWIQLPGSDSTVQPPVKLTINGGSLKSTNYAVLYISSSGNSYANVNVLITGGIFINENSKGDLTTENTNSDAAETISISGGTFSTKPSADYLADGYAVATVDSTYLIYKPYTITWIDEDGTTVLETDTGVTYEATPTYDGTTPTKAGNAQYTYEFGGWTPEVVAATEDATYKAFYTALVNTYDVAWQYEDGTPIKTEKVAYGTIPVYSGDVPTKDADDTYTYVFKGWTPKLVEVTGNAEYTAEFTAIEKPKAEEKEEEAPIQPVVQIQSTIDEVSGETTIVATVSSVVTVTSTTEAKIEDATGSVTLTVTFKEGANLQTGSTTTLVGTVDKVEAEYKEKKAGAASGAGEIKQQLTINLKNVTAELPKIVSEFKQEVKEQAVKHDNKFIPLAMITAEQTGTTTLDQINRNLTSTDGVKIVFTVEKGVIDRYGKDNIHVMHMKEGEVKQILTPDSVRLTADGAHYEITVSGNGFSNYVLGVKETESTSSGSQGSSVWLQEIPTQTPTPTPTVTQTPDVAPTDIPTTQPTTTDTAKSPGFGVLAVLAGLGAVAVLRRK